MVDAAEPCLHPDSRGQGKVCRQSGCRAAPRLTEPAAIAGVGAITWALGTCAEVWLADAVSTVGRAVTAPRNLARLNRPGVFGGGDVPWLAGVGLLDSGSGYGLGLEFVLDGAEHAERGGAGGCGRLPGSRRSCWPAP